MIQVLLHTCVSQVSLSNAHHRSERRDLFIKVLFFQSSDSVHCTHRCTHCLSSPVLALAAGRFELAADPCELAAGP